MSTSSEEGMVARVDEGGWSSCLVVMHRPQGDVHDNYEWVWSRWSMA